MGWNPSGAGRDERVQLETMDAGVTVRKWLSGERLAYQDRTVTEATRIEITDDDVKIRKVIPSALVYIQLGLTVVGVDGELEGFDATRRDHVDGLTDDTLDEILGICQRLNPTNAPIKKPRDHQPSAEGDAEDPSPAQPTAPEGSAASQG